MNKKIPVDHNFLACYRCQYFILPHSEITEKTPDYPKRDSLIKKIQKSDYYDLITAMQHLIHETSHYSKWKILISFIFCCGFTAFHRSEQFISGNTINTLSISFRKLNLDLIFEAIWPFLGNFQFCLAVPNFISLTREVIQETIVACQRKLSVKSLFLQFQCKIFIFHSCFMRSFFEKR